MTIISQMRAYEPELLTKEDTRQIVDTVLEDYSLLHQEGIARLLKLCESKLETIRSGDYILSSVPSNLPYIEDLMTCLKALDK
ncbi:MAG: hypothetical protein ACRCYY_14410 [Trueperaceae bacterium]